MSVLAAMRWGAQGIRFADGVQVEVLGFLGGCHSCYRDECGQDDDGHQRPGAAGPEDEGAGDDGGESGQQDGGGLVADGDAGVADFGGEEFTVEALRRPLACMAA